MTTVALRRWFERPIGGSWGNNAGESERDALCVRGTDLQFDRLDVDTATAPLRGFTTEDIRRRSLRPGDIVIEKSGGGDAQPVGRVGLFRRPGPAVPTNFAARLRPRSHINPRFASYQLASLYFAGRTKAAVKQTTGIQNLDLDELLANRVRLPPLAEQRVIADYLDVETARIDALIAKKQQLINLLDERVKALVFRGVSGRLTSADAPTRESGLDWLGQIPAHYGIPTLGAHFTTQLGKMLNAEAASGPDQLPYIKNTNVKWDSFDLSDLPTMTFDADDRIRCELRAGDLLVCEGGEVGRSAVWHGSDEPIYFQKALHRVRPLRNGNTRFLMYCLWAAASLDVFSVEGNQATIVHLTGEKLREHRFPWPPVSEQAAIVDLIDDGRRRASAVQRQVNRQLDLLAEHRQALITAAVTGEFVVPGAP